MKSLRIIILFLPLILVGQNNPFSLLHYDKVLAYEYQGEGGLKIDVCLENAKEKIANTIELNRSQVDDLEELFTSDQSYGTTTASCFDPHFAVVYYAKDEILAAISVCLDCNYLISSLEIPAISKKYIKVNEDYSYPAKGFSPIARKSIHAFCKEIGFDKYLKPLGSIYDD